MLVSIEKVLMPYASTHFVLTPASRSITHFVIYSKLNSNMKEAHLWLTKNLPNLKG
jgi:hypothetical protein